MLNHPRKRWIKTILLSSFGGLFAFALNLLASMPLSAEYSVKSASEEEGWIYSQHLFEQGCLIFPLRLKDTVFWHSIIKMAEISTKLSSSEDEEYIHKRLAPAQEVSKEWFFTPQRALFYVWDCHASWSGWINLNWVQVAFYKEIAWRNYVQPQ